MAISIPKQLRQKEIRFVLLEKSGKKPFQERWQTKNIKHDDKELLVHLNNGGNYGVMGGGKDNLLIVDFDNKDIQKKLIEKLPPTLTVKTGSGLLHKYFFSDDSKSFKIFNDEMLTALDVQGEGKQVVGAGSIHPNGKRYEVIDDKEIAFVPYSELKALILPLDKKPKKQEKIWEKPKEYQHNNFLNEVQSSVSIEQILSDFGVDISKNPSSCPFHSSKGGKCLGWQKEVAHCFHCDGAWNIFSLVMEYKKFTFVEALEWICNKYGLGEALQKSRKEYLDNREEIIQEEIKKKDYELIWEKDLQNYELENQEWIIDKLIPAKSVGVWTGKRGTLKTFIVLNAISCVASGKDFLGKYKTRKGKVIYLDKENGVIIMKQRMPMIKEGLGLNEPLDIGFICFSTLKIDRISDIEEIKDLIEQHKPTLLVVDTYRRGISFEENDAGRVSELFVDTLRPLVEKYTISIILIHHDRKGEVQGDEMDMIRGSSDLANYSDFILKNERRGKKLILKQLKMRSAPEEPPMEIEVSSDEDCFKFDCLGKYSIQNKDSKCAETLLLWIVKEGLNELQTKDAEAIALSEGFRKSTFKNSLNILQERGVLEKVAKGMYKTSKDSIIM